MGRTNGHLIPFLMDSLQRSLFINLKYEDAKAEVFYFEFPRFDKNKDLTSYEQIFKAWFQIEKLTYSSYSNGKSVFQAAIKKSVFLMPLPTIGKRLRFRRATPEETKEKRRLLKEKSNASHAVLPESPGEHSLYSDSVSSPNPPPSESSSGYHSGEDEENTPPSLNEHLNSYLEDLLKNPDALLTSPYSFDDLFTEEDSINENAPLMECSDNGADMPNVLNQSNEVEQFLNPLQNVPVVELSTIPVDTSNIFKKKYWLCTQKLKVEPLLILICDEKVIEEEDKNIQENQVVIPNGVWEPGIHYEFQKAVEVGSKYFCFFVPSI